MTRNIRKFVVLPALVALCAAAVVAPTISSAAKKKTYKVSMKTIKTKPPVGTTITGTFKGKPYGICKMVGTLVLPNSTQKWTCGKAGSFRIKTKGTSGAANESKGTWTVSKGTGKYKGITGKGTLSGLLSTGIFTYKGTVKY